MWTTVPFAIRARMNEAAWLSVLKNARSKLPPRTRTIATTLRLPVWFRAKRRSRDKTSIISFKALKKTKFAMRQEQMSVGVFSLYYRMPRPPKASDELTASVSPRLGPFSRFTFNDTAESRKAEGMITGVSASCRSSLGGFETAVEL